MLLTNRRHRILFMALAAMEVSWFLPFALTAFIRIQRGRVTLPALLFYAGDWSPLVFFALCWGALLLYLLSADFFNRWQVEVPWRELSMIVIVLGTFLLSVRILIFPTAALLDVRWLLITISAIYNQGPGSSPILLLLAINFFLWIRVATATGRSLTFFSVGVSFRLGMLLALVGNGMLILWAGQPVTQALLYLWLFFGFGLLAVALARVDEKAFHATQSSGVTLPWGRLVQLVTMTLGTIFVAVTASQYYTPAAIRTVLGWFSPLWNFLGALLLYLFSAIIIILGPFLERLAAIIRDLIANLEPVATEADYGPLEPVGQQMQLDEIVRNFALVRYCMVTLALLVIFFILWLFFVRTRNVKSPAKMSSPMLPVLPACTIHFIVYAISLISCANTVCAADSLPPSPSRTSMRTFAAWPAAAAIPAPLRNHPMNILPNSLRPSPAIPQHSRLTNAYMRVHYGDLPATEDELSQLRSDYAAIQATPTSD
ncbi:MAG: hypothetical protein R2932_43750 [Caldilineaceae bacterium]